jgi:hypothetical protein
MSAVEEERLCSASGYSLIRLSGQYEKSETHISLPGHEKSFESFTEFVLVNMTKQSLTWNHVPKVVSAFNFATGQAYKRTKIGGSITVEYKQKEGLITWRQRFETACELTKLETSAKTFAGKKFVYIFDEPCSEELNDVKTIKFDPQCFKDHCFILWRSTQQYLVIEEQESKKKLKISDFPQLEILESFPWTTDPMSIEALPKVLNCMFGTHRQISNDYIVLTHELKAKIDIPKSARDIFYVTSNVSNVSFGNLSNTIESRLDLSETDSNDIVSYEIVFITEAHDIEECHKSVVAPEASFFGSIVDALFINIEEAGNFMDEMLHVTPPSKDYFQFFWKKSLMILRERMNQRFDEIISHLQPKTTVKRSILGRNHTFAQ